MMDAYNYNVTPTENAQQASLAARGLSPGSQGYSNVQKTQDDARAAASQQAYLASGNEARANQAAYNDASTQRFNMNQSADSYLNNLRGAQMQEAYQARTQPINEVTSLMSGAQATVPQFQAFQGSAVQPSNIGQYINSNYQTQSQAAAQENAGIFSMVGGLAEDDTDAVTGGFDEFRWWRGEGNPKHCTRTRLRWVACRLSARTAARSAIPYTTANSRTSCRMLVRHGKYPVARGLSPDMFTYKSPSGTGARASATRSTTFAPSSANWLVSGTKADGTNNVDRDGQRSARRDGTAGSRIEPWPRVRTAAETQRVTPEGRPRCRRVRARLTRCWIRPWARWCEDGPAVRRHGAGRQGQDAASRGAEDG